MVRGYGGNGKHSAAVGRRQTRSGSAPPARLAFPRSMADLADHAFAHAASVLGQGDAAVEAAVIAVRRGGRSLSAVLGHARVEVLARAGEATVADLDAEAPDDLAELAAALARTRPVIDRVIVDLEARHGLDRAAFGRALGTSTGAAAARAAEVSADWQAVLDPVVLAHLGPGGCDGLASALGFPSGDDRGPAPEADGAEPTDPPTTLRELLDRGPAVADHAAGCATCGDRLRSMVSVRALLGRRPLASAPAPVRTAAAPSRLRRPSLPPPLEPAPASRRWARMAIIVGVGVAFAAVGGIVAAARRAPRPEPVVALTRVPESGSALAVAPASVDGRAARTVRLTNRSSEAISWVAVPDPSWVLVSPSEGRLEEGETTTLRVRVSDEAPEGDVRGSVQISGHEGSATVVRLAATLEHPPDVAATADACTIEAMVEDEGEVRTVELHWLEPPSTPGGRPEERIETLAGNEVGYRGRLPNAAAPITWWVAAVDARGNRARTPDEVLSSNACP